MPSSVCPEAFVIRPSGDLLQHHPSLLHTSNALALKYNPEHGFLGKSPGFALSRQFGASRVAQGKLETGPLRVLLFTSLPDDVDAETARLDVEEEQARVQEAWKCPMTGAFPP